MINGTDWLVIGAGLAAIAWVNWYFFLAGRTPVPVAMPVAASSPGSASARETVPSGPTEHTIVVDGGYSPAVLQVEAGRPLRLVFDRRDSGSCSEEVVFPEFGIRKFLPSGKRTVVEVTPPKAGRYDFTCGMSMLRGTLVVTD